MITSVVQMLVSPALASAAELQLLLRVASSWFHLNTESSVEEFLPSRPV